MPRRAVGVLGLLLGLLAMHGLAPGSPGTPASATPAAHLEVALTR